MEINKFKCTKNSNVIENVTINEWLSAIKESEYSGLIENARAGYSNFDSVKLNQIPCVTYNFTFDGYKNNGNIKESTGFLFIDIDKEGFSIDIIDKNKVYAYYKSFGGNGYHLLLRVDGITQINFKDTYFNLVSELGLEDYIDSGAVKMTQFSVLSYDPQVYVNVKCVVFKAVEKGLESNLSKTSSNSGLIKDGKNLVPTPSINILKERAYVKMGYQDAKLRFDNLDEIPITGAYGVNWDGWEYVKCYPLNKKKAEGSYSFILSFLTNFKHLNPHISKKTAFSIAHIMCEISFINKPNKENIHKAIECVFGYFDKGVLKPKVYYKTRKILFNKNSGLTRNDKMDIVIEEIKKKWKTISEQKIYNIIENWDFTVNGKITQRIMVKYGKMSRKTISKYWPSFKEYIEELNKKELHLQSKPKKDEIKEKTNTDNKGNGTGIQPICSNTGFTDDSLCEIQLSKNLKTNSEAPSSVWTVLNQSEMDI